MSIVDFDPSVHFHGRYRWWPRSGRFEDMCRGTFDLLDAARRMTDQELMRVQYSSWENYDILQAEVVRRQKLDVEEKVMASETKHNELRVIGLSRREAAEIIAFLGAQLAGTPLPNNASGAAPSVNIVKDGVCEHRLVLSLEEVAFERPKQRFYLVTERANTLGRELGHILTFASSEEEAREIYSLHAGRAVLKKWLEVREATDVAFLLRDGRAVQIRRTEVRDGGV